MYRLTDTLAIVQTVDFFPPVVDDPYIYGQIAAANALSDVYAMGGTPITAMNLVGYPDDKLGTEWLGRIMAGGAERCQVAGCTIVGGHTIRDNEIKFGLSVTGTIYAPSGSVKFNGSETDTLSAQVIVYNFQVNGSGASFQISYDPANLFHVTGTGLVE